LGLHLHRHLAHRLLPRLVVRARRRSPPRSAAPASGWARRALPAGPGVALVPVSGPLPAVPPGAGRPPAPPSALAPLPVPRPPAAGPASALARLLARDRAHPGPDPRLPSAEQPAPWLLEHLVLDLVLVDAERVEGDVERRGDGPPRRLHPLHGRSLSASASSSSSAAAGAAVGRCWAGRWRRPGPASRSRWWSDRSWSIVRRRSRWAGAGAGRSLAARCRALAPPGPGPAGGPPGGAARSGARPSGPAPASA